MINFFKASTPITGVTQPSGPVEGKTGSRSSVIVGGHTYENIRTYSEAETKAVGFFLRKAFGVIQEVTIEGQKHYINVLSLNKQIYKADNLASEITKLASPDFSIPPMELGIIKFDKQLDKTHQNLVQLQEKAKELKEWGEKHPLTDKQNEALKKAEAYLASARTKYLNHLTILNPNEHFNNARFNLRLAQLAVSKEEADTYTDQAKTAFNKVPKPLYQEAYPQNIVAEYEYKYNIAQDCLRELRPLRHCSL